MHGVACAGTRALVRPHPAWQRRCVDATFVRPLRLIVGSLHGVQPLQPCATTAFAVKTDWAEHDVADTIWLDDRGPCDRYEEQCSTGEAPGFASTVENRPAACSPERWAGREGARGCPVIPLTGPRPPLASARCPKRPAPVLRGFLFGRHKGSRGCSSAGRALHSHCRGQGFEPPQLH
jgi:hypothetical protein